MIEKSEEFMLQIGSTLISLDVIEKKFICNISKCMGSCCIHGDSGAPLEKEEIKFLEENYSKIKKFITDEGKKAIKQQGVWMIDQEGDQVTPLINGRECAYTVFEKGIATCGIEKAHEAGKITWQKPISCHLYPIRIQKYAEYDAVNYDKWEICKPALKLGAEQGVAVYQFLKAPLITKYGEDWYEELCLAAEAIAEQKED